MLCAPWDDRFDERSSVIESRPVVSTVNSKYWFSAVFSVAPVPMKSELHEPVPASTVSVSMVGVRPAPAAALTVTRLLVAVGAVALAPIGNCHNASVARSSHWRTGGGVALTTSDALALLPVSVVLMKRFSEVLS